MTYEPRPDEEVPLPAQSWPEDDTGEDEE